MKRKSSQSLSKIYFWTATIHNWLPLLDSEENKELIIDLLHWLSHKKLVTVYGFVIMPNHMHIIWEQHGFNGNETPLSSLMKQSSYYLLQKIKEENVSEQFVVNAANKIREIWKRDSLAIEIYSRKVAKQKLDYIHSNPVNGKWKLSNDDISYPFSSANFYETGIDQFGFLSNLYTVFDGAGIAD
jgi:REP element-mobilizing transposase RayT